MTDEQLSIAIYQVIDSLSFMQTHEVDIDFRVHSKATVDTLRSLQTEQRNRIEKDFGPRPPSPDFLATQLLATYRGEAASLQLAKESGDPHYPTAIETMSATQCRTFKKEMKQRIHEWEGAVREAIGQSEVPTQQKAMLRSIYELYKASKSKVVMLDSQQPQQAHLSGRRSAAGSLDVFETSRSMPPSQRGSLLNDNSVISAEPFLLQSEDSGTIGGVPSGSGHLQSGGAESLQRGSVPLGTGRPARGSGPQSSAASPGASSSSVPIRGEKINLPRVHLGTTPPDLLSTAELQIEKRHIKQVLHRFETEFLHAYGEPPNRHDRRNFSAEYHRYGALKNELARRTGVNESAIVSSQVNSKDERVERSK
ncbi:unnamed protein product [Phytomonas sp. EM1]|nr:unnamed protein product [Phytomonas sp. EM1]|eukprot:CCW64771.1 unnamed protein product [Phytomonas sp. isolate EM1]